MTKKTASEFFYTRPIRTADSEEVFHFSPAKQRKLPKSLREPLIVNMVNLRSYWQAKTEAGHFDLNENEQELYGEIYTKLRHRWAMMADIYGVQAHTLEDWRRLAMILATESIPGLQVEIIDNAKPAPRVRTSKNISELISHVQKTAKEMGVGKTAKSTKLTTRTVLKYVFNHWPEHLGKRRANFNSFETHYHQVRKARYQSMSLLKLAEDYKIRRR